MNGLSSTTLGSEHLIHAPHRIEASVSSVDLGHQESQEAVPHELADNAALKIAEKMFANWIEFRGRYIPGSKTPPSDASPQK